MIARHRQAAEAFEAAANPERVPNIDAALDALNAATAALFTTVPTTQAGLKAWIGYIEEEVGDELIEHLDESSSTRCARRSSGQAANLPLDPSRT